MAASKKLNIVPASPKTLKPVSRNEALNFEALSIPRCKECGSDLEPSIFGLRCQKCEERQDTRKTKPAGCGERKNYD